jgi:CheY-like chemotaxis protein
MDFLRNLIDPAIRSWGILLGYAALVVYIVVLHRRNSSLKRQLEMVNERLTHMQADVRRYLSAISRPSTEPVSPPGDLRPPAAERKLPEPQEAPRVLVADDNPELLELMEEMLQEHGYVVTTVRTGVEAIESITAGRQDIVVLDILMPHMNGLELLQKMKDAGLDTPVLIVTAYSDAAESTREFGNVKGVILKPFNVSDLLNRMDEIRQQIGK